MVRVWQTMDTTVRGRGNGYKSIATIAVIAGVYVSIVSVLRFGRFLAGFNCTTPPPDNDLSVSRKSRESHKIRERSRNLSRNIIIGCIILNVIIGKWILKIGTMLLVIYTYWIKFQNIRRFLYFKEFFRLWSLFFFLIFLWARY